MVVWNDPEKDADVTLAGDSQPVLFRSAFRWMPAGVSGRGPIMREQTEPTPLAADESEDPIPAVALWAMKDVRRTWFDAGSEDDAVRWRSDDGDGQLPIFVIDDGPDHCMVSRIVGSSPDGTVYCLVTRVTRVDFEMARQGPEHVEDLLSLGHRFTLCGVVEGSVGNVVLVANYRKFRNIPAAFLPPTPFIAYSEPL